MADFRNITSPDLALVAVPARRGFTNPDGSPSFRLMLEHFRYEVSIWRARARRNSSGKLSGFDLGTIAADLRHCAEREEIASGWHPLRATADAFDAEADKRGLRYDDTSRALAVLALASGRPALSSRCQNGGCIMMDLLNRGEASAADLAASPLDLAGAVALNPAGERLLREARAIATPAAAVALAA